MVVFFDHELKIVQSRDCSSDFYESEKREAHSVQLLLVQVHQFRQGWEYCRDLRQDASDTLLTEDQDVLKDCQSAWPTGVLEDEYQGLEVDILRYARRVAELGDDRFRLNAGGDDSGLTITIGPDLPAFEAIGLNGGEQCDPKEFSSAFILLNLATDLLVRYAYFLESDDPPSIAIRLEDGSASTFCSASGQDVGRMIERDGWDEWRIECPECGMQWCGGGTRLIEHTAPG